MSLVDTIANAVAIADTVTHDLQDQTVVIIPWTGEDVFGTTTYDDPFPAAALVELSSKPSFSASGQLIETKANVTFLRPVPPTAALAGQTRTNPIDPRDIIILPDGTTGPIIRIGGFVNAQTHRPYMSEVTLGK
jgi:hypothetical protein